MIATEIAAEPKPAAAAELPRFYILTLQQPYASLVALSIKQLETRPFRLRGEKLPLNLLIHAGLSRPAHFNELVTHPTYRLYASRCPELEAHLLPTGRILARTIVNRCMKTETLTGPCLTCTQGERWDARSCPLCHGRPFLDDFERFVGDYSPGRYAWDLGPAVKLPEGIPHRGNTGLHIAPAELVARVLREAPFPWESA